MKYLIMMILTIIIHQSHGGEVTGAGGPMMTLLKENKLNPEQLIKDGYQFFLGEATGAGMAYEIERIRFLLSKKRVYSMKDLRQIEYLRPSANYNLNDVHLLDFGDTRLKVHEIKGIILQ